MRTTQTTFAERAGRTLGRTWRQCVRLEQKAKAWLVARGVPAGLATALFWMVKLAALGALLYAAFWIALLLAIIVGIASSAGRVVPEEDAPEWRIGLSGYGLYRGDERIDPGTLDDD